MKLAVLAGRVAVISLGVSLLSPSAQAQIYHLWDGGGTNNNWSLAGNWNPDGTPPNPTTNYVNLAGTTRLTPVVDADWTIFGLFVSNNAGAFTLGGSNVTLTASTPDSNPPHAFESRAPSNFVMHNTIILPGSTNIRHQFLVSSAANVALNGVITNSGPLGMQLWLRGSGSGTGTITNRILLGTNKLAKADSTTWVINNTGNSWGDTDIFQTGVLRIAVANALPTNTLVSFPAAATGGRLDLNNFNQTIAGLTGTGVVRTGQGAGGMLTINSDGRTNQFFGNITENGSLMKLGSSVQILMTNHTFTGSVVVAGGALQVGVNRGNQLFNGLGPGQMGRSVTVSNGAVLDLRGRDIPGSTGINFIIYGTLTNEGYSQIGPVTLNGGRIDNGIANAAYRALAFRNSITVTGSAPSLITSMPGNTNALHLEQRAVIIDVRDVTGNTNVDLNVTAVLGDSSPNNAGAGGFIKTGAGSMLLDGANVFSGTASVSAGTLVLGSQGSVSNATVSVGAGALFDVTAHELAFGSYTIPAQATIQGNGSVTGFINSADGARIFPGLQDAPGTLTFLSDVILGAGTTNTFDLTNDVNAVGGGTNDLLVFSSANFEPLSAVVRINPLVQLPGGTYRLINYAGNKFTTFDTNVVGDTTRDTWTLDESVANQVNLLVSAGTNQSLVWSPQVSSVWDAGASLNWTNVAAGVQDVFYDRDTVLFDDSGAASNVVSLLGTLRPAAVTVNSASNYTFAASPGVIENYNGYLTPLTKDGTGTLTILNTNKYGGDTVVSNGAIVVGNGGAFGAIGSGTVAVASGAGVTFFRSGDNGISNNLAGAGTVAFRGPGASGSGSFQISGVNTGFTGTLSITNARIIVDSASDVGPAALVEVQNGGQVYHTAGTVDQPVQITGLGWLEGAGTLGAIRFQGGQWNGPITLAGNARLGAFGGNGFIGGPISGPYEVEFWSGQSNTITIGPSAPSTYASTRVSGNVILVATNANAFATGPLAMNGGSLRFNGNNFAFSNISATVSGGVIQNNSTSAPATMTVGTGGDSSSFGAILVDGQGIPGAARHLVSAPLNLTKTGAGSLVLAHNTATGTNLVSQGTLVITNGSWSGPLSLAAGASAVAVGGQGLLGEYYVTTPTQAAFNTLALLNASMATLNPAILYKSTAAGGEFSFGNAGQGFPPGFNAASSNFQVRWVGKLIVTNTGVYSFGISSDDGSMLWIDGAVVTTNNSGHGITQQVASVTLTNGSHDIVYAYWQSGGGFGFTNSILAPGDTVLRAVPNSMLASGPGVGSLSGESGSSLYVSNGLLGVAQAVDGVFNGAIAGDGGLYKMGTAALTLHGDTTYADATTVAGGSLFVNSTLGAGAVVVQAGSTLGGTGMIGGATLVQDAAFLQPATPGTVGTLSLAGNLTVRAATNVIDVIGSANDRIAASGLLSVSNGVIALKASGAVNGSYTVGTYGTLAGQYRPTVVNLGGAGNLKNATIDYSTANEIRLVLADRPSAVVWNSPTNILWDVAGTPNWYNAGFLANDLFYNGDGVLFDDRPGVALTSAVPSGASVNPSSFVITTSTNVFVLQFAGAVTGTATIVKNGTNTVTISDTSGGAGVNQNLSTGGMTVNAGKVILQGQNDGARTVGSGLITVNAGASLQTDSANTLGQSGTGLLNPVLLDGGRFRPNANNHMNQLILQNGAYVERYNSAGGAGLDFFAITGTPAQIHVPASAATITNDARMSINNSASNTYANVEDGAPAIDAEFSAQITGTGARFLVYTNTGTLLLSGANDNNSLQLIINTGTVILGKTSSGGTHALGSAGELLVMNGGLVQLGGTGGDQIYTQGDVRVNSGVFDLNGRSEGYDALNGSNGAVIINSAAGTLATNTVGLNNSGGFYAGVILDGAGTVAFRKAGSGTQVLTASNDYSGGTVVAGGTLTLSNTLGQAIRGPVTIGDTVGNDVLLLGAAEQVADASVVTFNSGTSTGNSAKFQLMGNTETIGGIAMQAGTVSVIQNMEAETVNADGRLVVNSPVGNLSMYTDIIRDRQGGTGTGRLHLTKDGEGTLLLLGPAANTLYSGGTIISNGTLAVNGALPLNGSATVVVDGGLLAGTGTINRATTVNAGAAVQPGSLAFADALAVTTVTFNANSALSAFSGGTGSLLRVTGNNGLTLPPSGVATVKLASLLSAPGTYRLATYAGSIQGGSVAANLALVPQARSSMSLVDSGSSIDLSVSSVGETAVKWTGAVDASWDIGATTNWLTQAGLLATAYLQPGVAGDTVLLDDSASGNFSITIASPVNPSGLTVSNSVNDYALAGASIGGSLGLVKDGTAKLTVSTTNTFAGPTVVRAGRLAVAAESSLGLAPAAPAASHLVLGSGAALEVQSSLAMSPTRGLALGTAGASGTSTLDTLANHVVLAQPVINAAGATGGLTKAGSGQLTLAVSNSFSGPLNVDAGVVHVGTVRSLGFNSGVTIADGGQVNLNGINQANIFYPYTISGAGPDGRGAIVNSNASLTGNSTVRWLTLASNATIGALGNLNGEGNRFDVYNSQGNGFSLTKVGHSSVSMRGVSTNLQLIVNEGFVYTESVTNGLGTNVIINSGGYVGGYGNVPGRLLTVPVVLNGGTLSSRQGANLGGITWSGPITLTADSYISAKPPHYGDEGIFISGAITGTNLLRIHGTASNVVFLGTNTYSGGTEIAGRLNLGENTPGGSIVGPIAMVSNSVLTFNRTELNLLSGVITGTGNSTINQFGSGTSILSGAGSTFNGGINVTNGALVFDGGSFTTHATNTNARNLQIGRSATVVITNGASIDFGGHVHLGAFAAGSGANLIQYSGSLVIRGQEPGNGNRAFEIGEWPGETSVYTMVSGYLSVTNGVVFLPWNASNGLWNMYSGTAVVRQLQFNAGSAGLGFFNFEGGRLVVGPGGITINNGQSFLNIGGGTISAYTNWVTARPMTLTGTNGPATFDTAGWNITLSNVLSGAGGLIKSGAGTLTSLGVNTYTGPTAISNGTLAVFGGLGTGDVTVSLGATLAGTGSIGGAVTSSGTVTPGTSLGALPVAAYTQDAGAALNIELGGVTTPGVDYDTVVVAGQASLDGALNVTLTNGFAPVPGNQFLILQAASRSGTFSSTNLPAIGTNVWTVEYTGGLVILSVGAPPPAGYDVFALQITNAADRAYQADPDGDGYANLLEYVTGGSPTNFDQFARMNAARTNGAFALRFTRNAASIDATLFVEGSYASNNDASWTGIAINSNGLWSGAATVSETGGPNLMDVTVQDTDPAATNRFLRLRVTRP